MMRRIRAFISQVMTRPWSPGRRSAGWIYFAATTSMFAVTLWYLWRIPNNFYGMYGNIDGYWAAWNLKGLADWSAPVDMSPFNPLSGLGSQFLPNLPWLNPGALVFSLPIHRDIAYLLSYAIYFLELSLSLIVLCRAFKLSPILSALASQSYALILFPPWHGYFSALPWYSLAPVNAHLVAVCNFMLVALLRLGNRSNRENLIWGLVILALAVSGFVSAPITFVTYAPAYGLVYISVLAVERPGRRALGWTFGTLLAVAMIFIFGGAIDYLAATAANSSRAFDYPRFLWPGLALLDWSFWRDLWKSADMCSQGQFLLCFGYPLLSWIHVLAIYSAVIEIVDRKSPLRGAAYGLIVLILSIHAYHLLASKSVLGPLQVVSTPFLWWSSYAFVAVFAATLAGRIAAFVWRLGHLRSTGPRPSTGIAQTILALGFAAALLLAVPGFAYVVWKKAIQPHLPERGAFEVRGPLGHSRIRAPHVGAVTKYLIDHASISPGASFRGYVVTSFGDHRGSVSRALDRVSTKRTTQLYEESRALLDQHFGNMYQDTDLWRFGIPTFEEYGQWITKRMLLFSKLAFTENGDEMVPFLLRALRPDFEILQSLGVRFVISDSTLDLHGAELRAEDNAPDFGSIYLYELPHPNLGTFSPMDFVAAKSLTDSVRQMKALGTSIGQVVVAQRKPDDVFVAPSDAELRFERDGFRLIANSPGKSYLLIPVQYSRCWVIADGSKGGDSISLERANAVITLVGFRGHVDARFKLVFGPPGSSSCRKQDAEDHDSSASH